MGGMLREVLMRRRGPAVKYEKGGKRENHIWVKNMRKEEISGIKSVRGNKMEHTERKWKEGKNRD